MDTSFNKIHHYNSIDVKVNFEAWSSLVCTSLFFFLYSKEKKS